MLIAVIVWYGLTLNRSWDYQNKVRRHRKHSCQYHIEYPNMIYFWIAGNAQSSKQTTNIPGEEGNGHTGGWTFFLSILHDPVVSGRLGRVALHSTVESKCYRKTRPGSLCAWEKARAVSIRHANTGNEHFPLTCISILIGHQNAPADLYPQLRFLGGTYEQLNEYKNCESFGQVVQRSFRESQCTDMEKFLVTSLLLLSLVPGLMSIRYRTFSGRSSSTDSIAPDGTVLVRLPSIRIFVHQITLSPLERQFYQFAERYLFANDQVFTRLLRQRQGGDPSGDELLILTNYTQSAYIHISLRRPSTVRRMTTRHSRCKLIRFWMKICQERPMST